MSNRFFLTLIILVVGSAITAHAQYVSGTLSHKAEISVLTVGAADQPYTAFGHTAIRLYDPVNNINRIYNFETFNAERP